VSSSEPAARGQIGDEDPLQAVADVLAVFPAGALILAVHAPGVANWRDPDPRYRNPPRPDRKPVRSLARSLISHLTPTETRS
jgi:hypothetical protein